MRGCLQHDENDCGLACILTICKFLKISVDEKSLRKNIFLGNEGLSLYGITRVFSNIGIEEAEDLIKDLKKALEGDDIDKIKEEKEKLQEKAMALAAKVYEQAAKERQDEETSTDDKKEKKSKKKKDDDVEEADIEEE